MLKSKGFISLSVLAAIILVVIIGGSFGLYYFNHLKQRTSVQSANPSGSNTSISITQQYQNKLLGFSIIYPSTWRPANDYTKRLYLAAKYAYIAAEEGCTLSYTGEEANAITGYNACLINKNSSIAKKYSKYNPWPGLENSDIIVLTDLSEAEEEAFLSEVTLQKKSLLDFPKGHSIQIYASEIGFTLKDHEPDSKSKIRIERLLLSDGYEAELFDSRAEPPLDTLTISIPHTFVYELYPGVQAKSLVLKTNIEINSISEKTFYDVLNSLKFL